MPIAKVQLPDGRVAKFEVPEGTTEQQVMELASQLPKQEPKGEGPSRIESLAMGLRDPISGAAQLLEKAVPESVASTVNRFNNWLVDQGIPLDRIPEKNLSSLVTGQPTGMDALIQQRERAYQAKRKSAGETGFDPWRMGGNVATSLLATRGLGTPATLGGRVAQGAGIGGLLGLTSPVTENQNNFWEQKAIQGGIGAAAGGAAPAILGGLARVIRPNTRPEVKALMDQGVTPTPGQILGKWWQVAEDKATSLPIVGDAIRSARGKSLDEFNRAVYSRALKPIGGKVPKDVGRDAVKAVRQQLSDAYDDLLPKVSFKADSEFAQGVQQLRSMASQLPKQQARQFEKILQTHVSGKMTPQGLMNGAKLKEVESELGRIAKGYSSDPAFDNRQLGSAVMELQNLIRQNLVRSNPKYADQLSKVNQGWANYTRIRDAASRQGSTDGKFTPAQLSAAVRAGDKTVGKRAFSEGDALLQDLSDAGKNVLAPKYPDSGTFGRAAFNLGALGGGYVFSPQLLTGAGAASLPYLPAGRQLTAALLARRPEAAGLLAEHVRALGPAGAGAAGLLANQ